MQTQYEEREADMERIGVRPYVRGQRSPSSGDVTGDAYGIEGLTDCTKTKQVLFDSVLEM